MQELLSLARQLRPAVLDDHGLAAALRTQIRDFAEQTGIDADVRAHAAILRSSPPSSSSSSTASPRRACRTSSSTPAQPACEVERRMRGPDGAADRRRRVAASRRPGAGGLGLSGMRERALLIGGRLRIASRPGDGTTVELIL